MTPAFRTPARASDIRLNAGGGGGGGGGGDATTGRFGSVVGGGNLNGVFGGDHANGAAAAGRDGRAVVSGGGGGGGGVLLLSVGGDYFGLRAHVLPYERGSLFFIGNRTTVEWRPRLQQGGGCHVRVIHYIC